MKPTEGAPLCGGGSGGAARRFLNLIHRNNCSNPALARVTARFDFPEGVPIGVLSEALKLPFPVAVEVLRRATR